MEQRIRFCTAPDGVRIAYAASGRGPPLVKTANWLTHLHFDWDSPVWRHWLAELSRAHTLVRYDERGCGLSDWDVPELSFESWVTDLEAVVDDAHLDRFPLLGLSQGAGVAIAYAVRHPERVTRLVLCGGYARGRLRRDPTPEARAEAEALEHILLAGWGRANPAFRQVFATLLMPGADREQAAWWTELQRVSTTAQNALRIERTSYDIDVTALAARLRVPTLVLHARDDAMIPFDQGRELAALIPGARLVPLESRNHVLLPDEPAWPQFLAAVREFLGTAVPAGATSAPLPQLSPRERAVLDAIARGLSNDDVAARLGISGKTVGNHITRIFRKLGVRHRPEAIVLAREHGLGRGDSTDRG